MTLKQIADAADRVDALQRSLNEAEQYVAKIGAAQPHYRDGSAGRLNRLTVSTEIHHQPSSGATNYHKCNPFDAALAIVVKERFSELAGEALAHMARAYHDALIGQKDALKGVLADVERLEAKAAQTDAALAPA